MSVDQTTFTRAMLDPNAEIPAGLRDPIGAPAGKRFVVYRNNVAASLSDALEVAFPVVRKLLGDEFFRAMAGVFLRQHQPNSPMLMFYGIEMPEFLQGFEPVSHLQYLPDVARVELAIRTSYHAADTTPIDPAILQTISPDALMASTFCLAPSLQLIRSPWPVAAIWHANTSDDAPAPVMQPEDVLIARPDYDPQVISLPPGGGAFIAALLNETPLEQALKDASISSGEFDFTTLLGTLLNTKAICEITKGPTQ